MTTFVGLINYPPLDEGLKALEAGNNVFISTGDNIKQSVIANQIIVLMSTKNVFGRKFDFYRIDCQVSQEKYSLFEQIYNFGSEANVYKNGVLSKRITRNINVKELNTQMLDGAIEVANTQNKTPVFVFFNVINPLNNKTEWDFLLSKRNELKAAVVAVFNKSEKDNFVLLAENDPKSYFIDLK